MIKDDMDAKILREDLDKLQKWCSTWLLQLHPQKCKYMRISKKKKEDTDQRYSLDSYILEKVEHEKDIGVTIILQFEFSWGLFVRHLLCRLKTNWHQTWQECHGWERNPAKDIGFHGIQTSVPAFNKNCIIAQKLIRW